LKLVNYLLDTNICIYIIKKNCVNTLKKFKQFSIGEIGLSCITVAELEYGVAKSNYVEQNNIVLKNFLLPLKILPFDEQAAATYGKIRQYLEAKGTPIGPLDLMIAAHAKANKLTLVTNNVKEFSRVPGLLVENWTKVQ
jgi:tRNA(fMet)-specific endonuclease VapC